MERHQSSRLGGGRRSPSATTSFGLRGQPGWSWQGDRGPAATASAPRMVSRLVPVGRRGGHTAARRGSAVGAGAATTLPVPSYRRQVLRRALWSADRARGWPAVGPMRPVHCPVPPATPGGREADGASVPEGGLCSCCPPHWYRVLARQRGHLAGGSYRELLRLQRILQGGQVPGGSPEP